MIERIYNESDSNSFIHYPFRYRLRLYKRDGEQLTMEYMKFRVGFWDYEEYDNVASHHSQSSYLWGEGQDPTWEEMSEKEDMVKEEFIRYMKEGITELEGTVERHNRRIDSLTATIEEVKMSNIRKHSFLI